MKKTARLFGAYLPVLLILLPVAVVLRTVACFKDMTVGGYFENKTLITVANVIIAALVLFSLTYLLVAKKDIKLVYRPQSPLNFIPGAIICAGVSASFCRSPSSSPRPLPKISPSLVPKAAWSRSVMPPPLPMWTKASWSSRISMKPSSASAASPFRADRSSVLPLPVH